MGAGLPRRGAADEGVEPVEVGGAGEAPTVDDGAVGVLVVAAVATDAASSPSSATTVITIAIAASMATPPAARTHRRSGRTLPCYSSVRARRYAARGLCR